MKKLLPLLLMLVVLVPTCVYPQATTGYHRISQALARANTGVTAQVVPYANVFMTNTSTGAVAVIYSDPLLSVQITSGTVTADAQGNYDYYIPLNYCVNENTSSPGQGSKSVQNVCSNSGPSNVTGQVIDTLSLNTDGVATHVNASSGITQTGSGTSTVDTFPGAVSSTGNVIVGGQQFTLTGSHAAGYLASRLANNANIVLTGYTETISAYIPLTQSNLTITCDRASTITAGGNWPIFQISGTNIHIDGCAIIEPNTSSANAIQVITGSSNIEISHVTCTMNNLTSGNECLLMYGTDKAKIHHNIFYGGIFGNGNVTNFDEHDNYVNTGSFTASAKPIAYHGNATGYNNTGTIHDETIVVSYGLGIEVGSFGGLEPTINVINNTVTQAYTSTNACGGFSESGSVNSVWADNSYTNLSGSICGIAYEFTGGFDNTVVGNTTRTTALTSASSANKENGLRMIGNHFGTLYVGGTTTGQNTSDNLFEGNTFIRTPQVVAGGWVASMYVDMGLRILDGSGGTTGCIEEVVSDNNNAPTQTGSTTPSWPTCTATATGTITPDSNPTIQWLNLGPHIASTSDPYGIWQQANATSSTVSHNQYLNNTIVDDGTSIGEMIKLELDYGTSDTITVAGNDNQGWTTCFVYNTTITNLNFGPGTDSNTGCLNPITAAAKQNLSPNSIFTSPTGQYWTLPSGWVMSPATGPQGDNTISFTGTGATNSQVAYSSAITLSANTNYSFSCWENGTNVTGNNPLCNLKTGPNNTGTTLLTLFMPVGASNTVCATFNSGANTTAYEGFLTAGTTVANGLPIQFAEPQLNVGTSCNPYIPTTSSPTAVNQIPAAAPCTTSVTDSSAVTINTSSNGDTCETWTLTHTTSTRTLTVSNLASGATVELEYLQDSTGGALMTGGSCNGSTTSWRLGGTTGFPTQSAGFSMPIQTAANAPGWITIKFDGTYCSAVVN